MFRPRHAYRSPITNRYRGKAKGCPVFNNLTEITSEMVEQHDECLECLAKLKNRTELYKTLADNNKPSNNVIKSLQRLSSSASNNRLKTCLQFLIIKVNEKSINNPTSNSVAAAPTPAAITTSNQPTTTIPSNGCTSPQAALSDATKDVSFDDIDSDQIAGATSAFQNSITRLNKRLKSNHHNLNKQHQHQKQKLSQLASPPQDQVSSTQDQVVGPTQDDHDCQTSPPMLTTTQTDDTLVESLDTDIHKLSDEEKSPSIKNEEQQTEDICAQIATTTTISKTTNKLSSPPMKCNALSTPKAAITTTNNTTSTSSSPLQVLDLFDQNASKLSTISSDITYRENGRNNQFYKTISTSLSSNSTTTDKSKSPAAKRRKTHNSMSSDQDTSSVASWSLTSYSANTPPSPTSSTSSRSSSNTDKYSDSASSSCCCSLSCSSCTSSPRNSPSPTPLSSPDMTNELEEPKLKLDEEKIRRIENKPVLFDDVFCYSEQPSVASTPTTSSGCSPGQRSTATQNSEQSSVICNIYGSRFLGLSTNPVIHMFQAPPTFVNSLKPCNLPAKSQEQAPPNTTPVPAKAELISCAICGVRDRPPNIVKIYEQNSCTLCTEFFAKFLERPSQLYCAQDGDCLMTFDSRCRACWIKICLQKFDIDEKHRKIGEDYAPKLLSSPNVLLITIDTSVAT